MLAPLRFPLATPSPAGDRRGSGVRRRFVAVALGAELRFEFRFLQRSHLAGAAAKISSMARSTCSSSTAPVLARLSARVLARAASNANPRVGNSPPALGGPKNAGLKA